LELRDSFNFECGEKLLLAVKTPFFYVKSEGKYGVSVTDWAIGKNASCLYRGSYGIWRGQKLCSTG
jgi:hypothetical protein